MKKLNLLIMCLFTSWMTQAQYNGFGPITIGGVPAGVTDIQWYMDGVAIPGAMSSTYEATAPGQYYATYTDATTTCNEDRTVLVTIMNEGDNLPITGSTNNAGFTDYQWYMDGTAIPTATTADYTAMQGGLYHLEYDNGTCVVSTKSYYVFTLKPYNPVQDINVGFVNMDIVGNVSTNDDMPAGSSYGTPVASGTNPTAAVPTMNPDGTYLFNTSTPGTYEFVVPVCPDGMTMDCPSALLTISVQDPGVLNPPVANNDVATGLTGTPIMVNVLENDQPGANGAPIDPTSVSITDAPSNGTPSVDPVTGVITYTPNPGFVGTDTFTYSVCDESTPTPICDEAVVIITVESAQSPNSVLAADDYNTTPYNTAVSGNAVTNDTDPQGDMLSVTPATITTPGVGTFVIDAMGDYTFTPTATFSGTTRFPYTVCDNGTPVACAYATVYITVVPPNMSLVQDINVGFVNSDIMGDVSTNDDMPTGSSYGTPVASSTNPTTAVPSMNPDGTYTFNTPNEGVYVFTVPVCPQGVTTGCPTSLLTITVQEPMIINPPVANNDNAQVMQDMPVAINVLSNDQPGLNGSPIDETSVAVVDGPNNGATSIDPVTGVITYTPNTGFVGTDTFTYTVCDMAMPIENCDEAVVIVTVLPNQSVNTVSATDDYFVTNYNTAVSGNAIVNDIDPQGDMINAVANTIVRPDVGTFTIAANGDFTFTPVTGYFGNPEFIYQVCDDAANVACTYATVHISVVPPVLMVAQDINAGFVNEDISGDISTNDDMPAGTTYGSLVADPSNPNTTLPTLNADGTYTFNTTLPGTYVFNIAACPSGLPITCPSALLTINVEDPVVVNPPIANNDEAYTLMETPVVIDVLSNDAYGTNGLPIDLSSVMVTSGPDNGMAGVNPVTGEVTYTPDAGFTGIDTFMYTICDMSTPTPLCDNAMVIVTIIPTKAPNTVFAADDYVVTFINTPVTHNALNNDSDPQGNTYTATIQNTTIAGVGTFVLAADGSYTFTPAYGYVGNAEFPYTICDNGNPQACADATVYITVRAGTPIALDDEYSISADDLPLSATVATNDTCNGNTCNFSLLTSVSNGTLTFNSDGTFTYNGNAGFRGLDSFTYVLCNEKGACDTAVAKINITAPLPVTLLSFDATAIHNRASLISWTVTKEEAMLKYEVEHSIDGQIFSTIGSIAPTNSSQYSLIHNNPVTGANYYRLAMYEIDGTTISYSDIKKVLFSNTNSIQIYPNPSKNNVNIVLPEITNSQVLIYSVDGRLVFEAKKELSNSYQLNIDNLANGIYNIVIHTDNGAVYTEQLVIKK